jgi:hypothetical protein
MTTVNLWLLCAAILAVIVWLVPEPQTCWLPADAPTRGMYADCWTYGQLST